jgi:hypothetical protein
MAHPDAIMAYKKNSEALLDQNKQIQDAASQCRRRY